MDKKDALMDSSGVKWRCLRYVFPSKDIVQCKTSWIKELSKMKKNIEYLKKATKTRIILKDAPRHL